METNTVVLKLEDYLSLKEAEDAFKNGKLSVLVECHHIFGYSKTYYRALDESLLDFEKTNKDLHQKNAELNVKIKQMQEKTDELKIENHNLNTELKSKSKEKKRSFFGF